MNKLLLFKFFCTFLVLFLFTGCATTQVTPLSFDSELKEAYLIDNPNVKISDFQLILERHFNQHGIGIKRIAEFSEIPEHAYSIRYTADTTWCFIRYLSNATVSIYKENLLIAGGRFHDVDNWLLAMFDFDPLLYNSPDLKLKQLYTNLLKEYPLKYNVPTFMRSKTIIEPKDVNHINVNH